VGLKLKAAFNPEPPEVSVVTMYIIISAVTPSYDRGHASVTTTPLENMNSNDLFSFLDETREGDDSDHDEPMDVETTSPAINKLPKRKVDTLSGVDVQVSTPKKQRLSSPKPVVLDDFETEAKREVAVSAGLTGAAETGSRLELKHQVCRKLTYG